MIKRIVKRTLGFAGLELKRVKVPRDDRELYLGLYGRESVEKRRFYNVSAGGHFGFGGGMRHPFWTNVDVDRPWEKAEIALNTVGAGLFDAARDIAHDPLTLKPLPLESGSAELVHSRVSVEHITDEAALTLFKEVKRVLKKGGLFRVVTPNIDLDYRAFLVGNTMHFSWYFTDSLSIEQKFLSHFAVQPSAAFPGPSEKIADEEFRSLFKTKSFEDALDYCTSKCSVDVHRNTRQYHINWWNPKKMERMLRQAGFSSVYLSAAEQSASPVMCDEHYFDNFANKVMMYMEAQA
jgi:SAM-dependent methyltransferase